MIVKNAVVDSTINIGHNVHLQKVHCPEVARNIEPGQFLNIKVSEGTFPLLRRPFSVCDVEGDYFYLMFNIHGVGTQLLNNKKQGEKLDILGPLGKGFTYEGDYQTAVIVAGGLGAAPFPYLTRKIRDDKNIKTFVGGRTKRDVVFYGMDNVEGATDDGSQGFQGNVVEMLEDWYERSKPENVKLFSCGPTPMLKAVKAFSEKYSVDCELSLECAMACGFGICQGCPVESHEHPDYYALVCKDGPVFNAKEIELV